MSVLVKGMEMPKSCLECDWCAHTIPADNYICYRLNRAVIGVAEEDVDKSVNVCCPIVPIQSHGDLIDRNELISGLAHKLGIRSLEYLTHQERAIVNWIEKAPVIIEAEEETC